MCFYARTRLRLLPELLQNSHPVVSIAATSLGTDIYKTEGEVAEERSANRAWADTDTDTAVQYELGAALVHK